MSFKDQLYVVPRYGDTLWFIGFFNWRGWPHLGSWITRKHYGLGSFWIFLLGTILMFGTEVFANSLRVFFRARPGINAFGLITVLFTAFMILIFNNSDIPRGFILLSTLIGPFAIFVASNWYSWEELMDFIWQTESQAMMIFFWVYLSLALIKVFGMYFMGWQNTTNKFKKGDSLIFKFLKKRVPYLKENFYVVLYEPTITILIGWFINVEIKDLVFGTYLIIAGICLFIQELPDFIAREAT